METRLFDRTHLTEAVKLLKKGEVVAFPTETVYGLGGDATNFEAVQKIFAAKGRPGDNPLISHVCHATQVEDYAEKISEKAYQLMDAFWPGPLTLILTAKKGKIASNVTAGLPTVSFRMPDNPLALELIKRVGKPLAAPSANTSGKPSPTTAAHVLHDLKGKISGIVDGGPATVGLESTVLDMTHPRGPVILRPGAITREQLEAIIGSVLQPVGLHLDTTVPKAPGMKYKHYSPKEPVYIVSKKGIGWEKAIAHFQSMGEHIGLLASDLVLARFCADGIDSYSLGPKPDATEASKHLYSGLRFFEQTNATIILAEELDDGEAGLAFMNRLEKAADLKRI